jgi:lipoic acid synthetase
MSSVQGRKPDWFKIRIDSNKQFRDLRELVINGNLHTVCKEASCPNIHECWGTHGTAAFMVLGDICTRHCKFCDVRTGKPGVVDDLEPYRLAESVKAMNLNHAFITMVTRDDLEDGGARILAETVFAIHRAATNCSVEVLSSDLQGKDSSIAILAESKPEIIGHNIETVRRLTQEIRSRSDYGRSLQFLKKAKDLDPGCYTKSSMMLGLGETREEVIGAMEDLRDASVDMLNIGQYLQPAWENAPVHRYWHPEEFDELKEEAMNRGFIHCESGPLVRSSYHAGEQFAALKRRL